MQVELPDKKMTLEFPDDMPHDKITEVIQSQIYGKKPIVPDFVGVPPAATPQAPPGTVMGAGVQPQLVPPAAPTQPQPVTPTMTKGEMRGQPFAPNLRLPGATGEQPTDSLTEFVKGVPGGISPRAEKGLTQDIITAPPVYRETIRAEKERVPKLVSDIDPETGMQKGFVPIGQDTMPQFYAGLKEGGVQELAKLASLVDVKSLAAAHGITDPAALQEFGGVTRKEVHDAAVKGLLPEGFAEKPTDLQSKLARGAGASAAPIATLYGLSVLSGGAATPFLMRLSLKAPELAAKLAPVIQNVVPFAIHGGMQPEESGKGALYGAGYGAALSALPPTVGRPLRFLFGAGVGGAGHYLESGFKATGEDLFASALLMGGFLALHGKQPTKTELTDILDSLQEAAWDKDYQRKNWQNDPSVQHFQKQGFEFVQSNSPEEVAKFEGQGYQKSGIGPDLWFKAKEGELGKPHVYEDELGFWRVQGTLDQFKTQKLAQEAAAKMGQLTEAPPVTTETPPIEAKPVADPGTVEGIGTLEQFTASKPTLKRLKTAPGEPPTYAYTTLSGEKVEIATAPGELRSKAIENAYRYEVEKAAAQRGAETIVTPAMVATTEPLPTPSLEQKASPTATGTPSAPAPRVYKDEAGWWRVEGTDVKTSSQALAEKAASRIKPETTPTPTIATPEKVAPAGLDEAGREKQAGIEAAGVSTIDKAKTVFPVQESVTDIEGRAVTGPLGIKLRGTVAENPIDFLHEVAHDLDARATEAGRGNELNQAIKDALSSEKKLPKDIDPVEALAEIYSSVKGGDILGILKDNPKWNKAISILDETLDAAYKEKPPTPSPAAGAKEPWQQTKTEYAESIATLKPRYNALLKEVAARTGADFRMDGGLERSARGEAFGLLKKEIGDPNLTFQDIEGYGHKNKIREAMAAGQTIPPEVLADYPDLAPKPEKAGEGKMYGFPGVDTEDIVRLATPGLMAGKSVAKGIQSLLPAASSPEHLTAAEIVGNHIGSKARDSKNQAVTLKKDKRMFDKLGVNNPDIPFDENIGALAMSALSTGRSLDTFIKEGNAPLQARLEILKDKLKGYADRRTKLFDNLLKSLEDAGVPLKKVRENYFEGMWTVPSIKAYRAAMKEAKEAGRGAYTDDVNNWKPEDKAWVFDRVKELLKSGDYGIGTSLDQADKSALSYLTKRPLAGKEGFRKAKTFEDTFTGMEFGLEPISYNPVKLDILKMEEMGRSLLAARSFREFKEKGFSREITATEPVPDGFFKLKNDKYGEIWGGTSIPVWKMLQELAKTAKKDLYFAKFGKEVFADPALKEELKNFDDLHKQKVGQKKSYSQVLMERLLEDPARFQEKAPGIYNKLQEIADNNPKLKEILGTPAFDNLQQKLPVGGKILKGYHVFTKPALDILDNYLSSSIYNNEAIGTAFKGYMATGNLLNQVQLGLGSMFHVGSTAAIAQVSTGANVLKDLYGFAIKGNRSLKDLGKTLLDFPTAMIRPAWQQGKQLADYATPQIDVPTNVRLGELPQTKEQRIALISKAVEMAGGAFDMEKGLRTNQSEKMIEDWYSGPAGKAKAILRSPIAFTEASMWPTMSWWVPKVKAQVFGELAGRIMEMNPGKTMKELRPQFRQAWNRTDARAGQVQYGRLFLRSGLKNAIQGLVRAPGWSGGTIGEIGGAPLDAARFVSEWIKTGKAPENFPDRVAFTLSLFATTAVVNGLMTKIFTGESPSGMDFWAFRDGGTDDKGNPTRMLLPTYMKDIFAYGRNWQHTLTSKAHPLISLVAEINRNRDYYGNMIWDEEEGKWNKDSLLKIGKYSLKAFEPFWMRGMGEIAEREGGLKETLASHPGKLIAPEFGVMPATKTYTQTDLDEVMNKYNKITITRTPEQAEETKLKRESQALIRLGKTEKSTKMLQEAIRSKKFDPEKVLKWQEEGEKPAKAVQFKNLPLEWQAKALLRATPEEEKLLRPLFEDKYVKTKDAAIDKAAPQIKRLYEMWKKRGPVNISFPAKPIAEKKEDNEDGED